jgi:hypothetical protein
LNISVYRLQPRLFIDSPPYLKKKTKRTIKSYGSAARLDQAIVIKAKLLKILLLALSFSFSQYPEFLKFVRPIGSMGQKIMRSANNVGPHVRQTFLNDVFTFLTEVGNADRIVNTGTSSVNSELVTALNT